MATFKDQDLTDAEFRECDLTRARLIGVVMQDAVIDGLVSNLVVNGVEVTSYVEAELDRRHPVRLLIRSADPADLRHGFLQLRTDWAATLERLQGMPKGSEHQRVGGEWSTVETLRHLVFVHDSWFRRCCLGSTEPFTAIGLASEFVPDQQERGLDPAATPCLTRCWPRATCKALSLSAGCRPWRPLSCRHRRQCQQAGAGHPTPGESRFSNACTWYWTRSGRTTVSARVTSTYSEDDSGGDSVRHSLPRGHRLRPNSPAQKAHECEDGNPAIPLSPRRRAIDSRTGCGLGCTGPWILAVVNRSPSGGSDDANAVPDVYRGIAGRPGPVMFTLDVDGERFAIRQAADGGTNYDWLSGPNKGYGFASSGTPNRSVEEHREHIRVFLAMIDPNTGYIGDD